MSSVLFQFGIKKRGIVCVKMVVISSFGAVKLLTVENKVLRFKDLDHFRSKLYVQFCK